MKTIKGKEKLGWKKHNREASSLRMTPEQCLEWLDGVRAFMLEVWKKNPELLKAHEKTRRMGL